MVPIPAKSSMLFVEGVSPDWTLSAFYGRSSDSRELPAAGRRTQTGISAGDSAQAEEREGNTMGP